MPGSSRGRRGHRAGDAGRARLRGGAARAGRLLDGLDESAIDRCHAERVRLNPGAATLVRTMRARGRDDLARLGRLHRFAEPVAGEIGFDRVEANRPWRRSDGKLDRDGRRADRRRRRASARRWSRRATRSASRSTTTLAVGDGANDMPMIEAAGLGIAYRAKPALAAVADARIDHHGLDALLWAQGIPARASGSRPSAPRPGSRAGRARSRRRPRRRRRGFRTARPGAG